MARLRRSRQEQVPALGFRVQADRRDLERAAGTLEPPGPHLEVGRVEHYLVDRLRHLDRDDLGAGERARFEVGFEDQIVATGDDGAGQAVAGLVVVHALSDRGLVGHALSRSRR